MKEPLTSTVQFRLAKPVSPENLYADRDHEGQGEHFMRHLDRMTIEGLHSKSAIAGELAHRDAEIAALKAELQVAGGQLQYMLKDQAVKFDEVAALKAERDALREDAGRYRWLRSDDIEVLPGQREICVTQERLPHTEDADITLTEFALDVAIDAAIAQAVQHG